ncbi:MAG: hypothetical protein H0W44_09505 [Gammaproteobacteria bacterium]|nr:hypothetical protein [Gammaproteobacteria bacterium]
MKTHILQWLDQVAWRYMVRTIGFLISSWRISGLQHLPVPGPAVLLVNPCSRFELHVLLASLPPAYSALVEIASLHAELDSPSKRAKAMRESLELLDNDIELPADGLTLLIQHSQDILSAGHALLIFTDHRHPPNHSRLTVLFDWLSANYPHAPIVPITLRGLHQAGVQQEGHLAPRLFDMRIGETYFLQADVVYLETAIQYPDDDITLISTNNLDLNIDEQLATRQINTMLDTQQESYLQTIALTTQILPTDEG